MSEETTNETKQLITTPCTFGENGNFLLERELGTGGMGGVYMGRDKMLDRPVAVKVMLKEFGDDAEFVGKFKKEAQAAARLIHPNIVQVYSYGICDGMPYIAMELASGGSLYSLMQANAGKTDIIRVMKICQQTAQALQCSTDQGYVHGDVKPENILLDANGNAKLVDFGLAAMQSETDEIWGTPYYISPEKVKKEPVDFRADMYSLGGTLYHALTGVAPFEGEDSIAVVKKRFEGLPKKPSEIRPEITPAIDALVMKMLALNKEERYPSFEALIQAFKDVLTTGLDAPAPAAAAPAAAPTTAKPATTTHKTTMGTRRMTVRGRRTAMMMKKKATAASTEDAEKPEGALDETDEKPSEENDDEAEGGSLGLKVVLFIVIGVLAIGGVIGGLIWFQVADKKAREEERVQMITANIAKARSAVLETRKAAEKFGAEFKDFAAKATEEAVKITDELRGLLPDFASDLQPPPSADLLKAIALTNPVPVVTAPAPAPAAATNAPAAKADAKKPADAKKDEAKKGDAKKDAKKPDAKKDAKKPEAKKDAKPAEEKKPGPPAAPKELPTAVTDVRDLWDKTYGCQAAEIRISIAVKKILATCDKEAELKGETEEVMKALGDLSVTVKDLYDQIVASKDVTDVKKNISLIKSKGKKVIEQTTKRLRIEKLEADRKAKKDAQLAAEKAKAEKAEADHKALVEKEAADIAAKFDAIAAAGSFRQLDWKTALRQLQAMKDEFKTSEGQIAADLQIRKVNAMKRMQDVFIANMKGHTFKGKPKKGVLNGLTVKSISEKEIQLTGAKGRSQTITWPKFYRDCPGNLNEAINTYIVHNEKLPFKARLGKKDWADAMAGAALTMTLVCAEVNGAAERAEQLAKEAVSKFSDYKPTAQAMFPDYKFEDTEE